jgi:hypothetical protein
MRRRRSLRQSQKTSTPREGSPASLWSKCLPGHFNAFMDDLRNNVKPIWEAQHSEVKNLLCQPV